MIVHRCKLYTEQRNWSPYSDHDCLLRAVKAKHSGMNSYIEYILVVSILMLNITLSAYATVVLKGKTHLQDLHDALCPSQLCSSPSKTELITTRWCGCDLDCDKFQDCCYDSHSAKMNGVQSSPMHTPHLNAEIKCAYVPSLGWSLMVSSCPWGSVQSQNATNTNRRLCSGRSEVQPHMLDIPVTSAATSLTYKNVHCAVCNEDADDLLPRKAALKGSVSAGSGVSLEGAVYEDGTLSWTMQSSDYNSRVAPEEEGSEERISLSKSDGDESSAAVLEEFLSRSKANFTDEGDWAMISDKVQQQTEDSRDYGEGSAILADDGNFGEAAPSESTSKFKGVSRVDLRTLKDLLNKDVLNSPEGFVDSGGELIVHRKESQENLSVTTDTMIKFRLYLDKEFMRPCGKFLDSCSPNWEKGEDDVSILCPTYSMPVYKLEIGKERRIFKNPHCALCNHVNLSELKCFRPSNFRPINRIWGKVILPKIDFTFGNVLQGHINCGIRSVWDPLFNQCYFLDELEETNESIGTTVPISVNVTKLLSELKEDLDGAEEMDKSITTPDPISINVTKLSNKLKETGPFLEGCIRGEDDCCKEFTLMTMSKVQWYLAYAIFGISIICLGLHVAAYSYPRKLVESSPRETENIRHSSRTSLGSKQITGHSFIILSWLLLVSQLLFAAGVRRSEIRAVCLSIAILHNFLSLASISWLSVFCLQVFKSHFSLRSFKSMSSFESGSEAPPLKLSLIAWIIPTVFSSLCLTLELVSGDLRPCLARGGACWYGETVSFRLFFVLPALLMLAGDGCIFTAIIFGIREKKDRNILTSSRGKSKSHHRSRGSTVINYDHHCFRLCARLGLIMAISWSCAAAASLGNLPSLWYGFVIFSGVQGIYIFVASGTKTRLTTLLWVKSTGQSGKVRRERSIKNNDATITHT